MSTRLRFSTLPKPPWLPTTRITMFGNISKVIKITIITKIISISKIIKITHISQMTKSPKLQIEHHYQNNQHFTQFFLKLSPTWLHLFCVALHQQRKMQCTEVQYAHCGAYFCHFFIRQSIGISGSGEWQPELWKNTPKPFLSLGFGNFPKWVPATTTSGIRKKREKVTMSDEDFWGCVCVFVYVCLCVFLVKICFMSYLILIRGQMDPLNF